MDELDFNTLLGALGPVYYKKHWGYVAPNTGYDWLKKKNFNIFFIVFLHHATFSFSKKKEEKLFRKPEKKRTSSNSKKVN